MFKDKNFRRSVLIILMIGLSILSVVATIRYAIKASVMVKASALIINALIFYFTYSILKNKTDGE